MNYKKLREYFNAEEAHFINDELQALYNLACQNRSIIIATWIGDEFFIVIEERDPTVIMTVEDMIGMSIDSDFVVVVADHLAEQPFLLNDYESFFEDFEKIIPYRATKAAMKYGLCGGIIPAPSAAQMN